LQGYGVETILAKRTDRYRHNVLVRKRSSGVERQLPIWLGTVRTTWKELDFI